MQNTMMPTVSIRIPTYGRPKVLNEAVECFLRQDYKGKKELVILNDLPGMEYEFSHPEVRVFNRIERYDSMGEKVNAAIRMTKYDVLMEWADDDIYLPWAISTAVEKLRSNQYFMNGGYWRVCHKKHIIKFMPVQIPGNAIYRKKLWEKLGGFIEGLPGAGEDTLFKEKVKRADYYNYELSSKETAYLIYRRSPFGFGNIGSRANGWARFKGYYVDKHPPGTYIIEPCWKEDYVELTRKWIADGI